MDGSTKRKGNAAARCGDLSSLQASVASVEAPARGSNASSTVGI